MTAPVSQVLSEAADLLEKPGAWTQGVFARNAKGENTGLSEIRGKAVCWCVLGATAASAGSNLGLSSAADHFLRDFLGVEELGSWNDAPDRSQEEVVDALRRAAALAKDQGR